MSFPHPQYDLEGAWTFTIAGVRWSGDLPKVTGTLISRKNDRHRHPTRRGARTVHRRNNLAKFRVALSAHNQQTADEMAEIIRRVYKNGGDAVPIEWPALALGGITEVTGDECPVPEPQESGLVTCSLELTEYCPPEPRDTSRTAQPAQNAGEYPRTAFDDLPGTPTPPSQNTTDTSP